MVWERTTKQEKRHAKWIRSQEEFKPRGRRQKRETFALKQFRRAKIREVKAILGRRLDELEMARYIPHIIPVTK